MACLRTPAPLRVYEPTKDIAWLLGPDAVPLLVQLRGVLHGHNAHRVRDTAAGSPALCSCSTAPTGALSNCSAAKPRAFFSPPNAHFFCKPGFPLASLNVLQAAVLSSARLAPEPPGSWTGSHSLINVQTQTMPRCMGRFPCTTLKTSPESLFSVGLRPQGSRTRPRTPTAPQEPNPWRTHTNPMGQGALRHLRICPSRSLHKIHWGLRYFSSATDGKSRFAHFKIKANKMTAAYPCLCIRCCDHDLPSTSLLGVTPG